MWDLDGKDPSHIANYEIFLDEIAAKSKGFGKPVLLINGDSHQYRSDNPLKENQSTYIPLGEKHRLENLGPDPLHLIEVQSGSYLGEDDITRFEDVYHRS